MNGMKNDWQKPYLELSKKLLEHVANENDMESVVCSPFSFYYLLALTMNALGGEDQKKVKELIGPGYTVDDLNEILHHAKLCFSSQISEGELISSNGICVRDDLYENISEDFKDMVEMTYLTQIFKGGEDMLEKINDWVNENTLGLIPKLLDQAPEDLALCLMNAVSFEAKWRMPYESEDIEPGYFQNADGSSSEVTYLNSVESEYIQTNRFHGFIKDYSDNRFALMALVPKDEEDCESLAKAVGQIDFVELYKERESGLKVKATMPEFEGALDADLSEFCKGLGLESLFAPGADFSGIIKGEDIMVSSILQKARIEVDANGTKAAAASAMMCELGCLPDFERTRRVSLDRPFIYAIIVKDFDGLPVFSGVVNKL